MSLELFINSGSIPEIDLSKIEGVRFEDVFSVSSPSCATLKYNTGTFTYPTVTPPFVVSIPETNYFMFNVDCSSDWDGTTPISIRLSLKALGRLVETTNYQQKLFEIIKNRLVNSEISITKKSAISESDPSTYKTFQILEASYFERNYDTGTEKFYAIEWGGNVLTETADFLGLFNYLPSSADGKDGFFTLVVTQTDTSSNLAELPVEDDELLICITPSKKYGFFEGVSGSFDSINITNVDITSASLESLAIDGTVTITGSLLLDGKDIDDVLSYSPKCAVLGYNTNTFSDEPLNANTVLNIPFVNKFIFNTENNIGWNSTTPTKIRINANTNSRQLIYRDALFNIIKNAYQGSQISFSYLKPGGGNYASLYKKFFISSGYYFERKFENGIPIFRKLEWGSENLIEYPDFYGEFSNPSYPIRDGGDAFFHLEVKQVATNNLLGSEENIYPFDVCITENPVPRKEVFEFTTTNTDWEVPTWANKITMYAVGAGGGGGGGAAAWGHSDTLPPKDIGSGQYHTISDEIGFEWATGGSGGAGGNLSVTELIIDKLGDRINSTNIGKELIPYGSKLSIFVGSGGFGGNGLTNNSNDYILIDKQTVYFADRNNTTNPKIFWIQKILNTDQFNQIGSEIYWTHNKALIGEYLYWSENSNNNWNVYPNRKIQIGSLNSNGKRGGYSNVTLKAASNPITYTNIELVHASGGNGGLNGVALQSFFALEHRFCEKDDLTHLFSYDHTIFPTFVPGGGSDLKKSFGNKYVNLGGHGGYGRAMPILRQNVIKSSYANVPNYKKLDYIDFDTVLDAISGGNLNDYPDTRFNIAPHIPWSSNFPERFLNQPIGSTYELTGNESYEDLGWKKYNNASYERPDKLAPLGGNGGLGASYNVLLNYASPEKLSELELDNIKFQRENGVPSIGIPNNWFEIISQRALAEIKWGDGYRPKINIPSTVFSVTPTRVNGSIWVGPYTFKLKTEGALGGLDIYKTVTGDTATPISILNRQKTQPENGGDYGQGGGGGAAAYTTDWNDRNIPISGQNGGNGANGIVIIVVE